MSQGALERRLRQRRLQEDLLAARCFLAGIGVREGSAVEQDAVATLWSRYLTVLRAGGTARSRWPEARAHCVKLRLDELRIVMAGRSVVWFWVEGVEPVGLVVSADELLATRLEDLVSRSRDLMVSTADARDGLCLELNHVSAGAEFEMVMWGDFADSHSSPS